MGEIRIVGPGKTRGYPCPVCKKSWSWASIVVQTVPGPFVYEKLNVVRRMGTQQQQQKIDVSCPQLFLWCDYRSLVFWFLALVVWWGSDISEN